MKNKNLKKLGIYLHVPFCLKKCPYCAFYSLCADETAIKAYVKKIINSIKQWGLVLKKRYIVDTVYFGGGTPNLLGEKYIEDILCEIGKSFCLLNPEITLEVNPFTTYNFDFSKIKSAGVNRLSIGMQSINNEELRILGRLHSSEQTIKTIEKAKNSKIDNISLDVILNIPGQSKNKLKKTIEFLRKAGVQHVSAYMLKIEKGTDFYNSKGKLKLLPEEEQCENYFYAVNKLKEIGFLQYEISNFSKEGKFSKHNLKYWNLEDYLGIGPSAHSLIDEKRFYYRPSLDSFLKGESPIIEEEIINTEEEFAMLQLRLNKELTNEEYYKKLKKSIPIEYFKRAEKLQKLGLLEIKNSSQIRLTTKGFLVSNRVIFEILYGI